MVEEVGLNGVTFLDLEVRKDEIWNLDGRVSICPYLKEASLKSVLLHSSSHPDCVHGAWTLAYVRRMFRHCSSLTGGRLFKQEVLRRMREAGIDQSLLDHIDSRSQFTFKCVVSRDYTTPVVPKRSQFWIPLPFHPVYVKAIKASLGKLSSLESFKELTRFCFGKATGFGVAWKLHAEPLASIVRKY